MANQLFGSFLYTDAGVAIVGATADLFDRNTTTPVRATTTTDANGYWSISHATEGRFDVRITNGTSIRWRKYDNEEQLTSVEVRNFRVRNPANTFDYDIVPSAITADRQLNLPLITGTATLAVTSDTGVSRVGGNTTEATTTSTTATDLLTVSSLTITAATPFLIDGPARKTGGAAAGGSLGLKLNTTVVSEPTGTTTNVYRTSGTDRAENGGFHIAVSARVTNYLMSGRGFTCNAIDTGGAIGGAPSACDPSLTASYPTATITDVILRGITANALVTIGADECHVYTLATS